MLRDACRGGGGGGGSAVTMAEKQLIQTVNFSPASSRI